jgi:hypothetical protein
MCLFMKIIDNYNQLPISALQSVRLYLQARPLLSRWSRLRRGGTVPYDPLLDLIDQEITGDYVAIDCAGWVFAKDQRKCTAIELHQQSLKYWHQVHFEYDYLTWHPTYLQSDTVLAYFSTYFKYCTLDDFLTFCKIWSQCHDKIIIGLDPTKTKYNYFKLQLLDLVKQHLPDKQFKILQKDCFSLVFTITAS